jgi:hypothetical protein
MAVTVLSGTSGALYYKPAGTTGTFGPSNVVINDETMAVQTYLNLKVGDPVKFQVIDSSTGGSGTGTLPAGLTAGTTYYVSSYTASSGLLKVSATNGGSDLNLTSTGTAAAPNKFEVYYNDYASVGQVQNWSFEVTRSEIDVTTIGQSVGQYAPFKTYISGFADGTGSASVYVTDEDSTLANRLIEDVIQRQQDGAAFKLYQDKQGTEALSRSIAMDAVLLSASFSVNPDDAQMVEVNFRPNNVPSFDFSIT